MSARVSIYTEASDEKLAEMLRWNWNDLPPDKILEVMAEALARLLDRKREKEGR